MHGGISHVNSFDPKPEFEKGYGEPLPFPKPAFEFVPTGNLLAAPWTFKRNGSSGLDVSDLFPAIEQCADELAIIRSMNGGIPFRILLLRLRGNDLIDIQDG